MTIIEALHDAQLFGALPAFRDLTSWRPWLAFLRAVYGLALLRRSWKRMPRGPASCMPWPMPF
jgi:hypothetical protein